MWLPVSLHISELGRDIVIADNLSWHLTDIEQGTGCLVLKLIGNFAQSGISNWPAQRLPPLLDEFATLLAEHRLYRRMLHYLAGKMRGA